MYVLAIETATPVVSVALVEASGATLAHASARRPREHVEMLTPMVSWVLSQAGVAGRDVAGVAVGTGPGRFSGLRVGVSSAKALAQAWGVPVVGLSTLDVLAAEQAPACGRLFASEVALDPVVCAVVDARRGECFAALYRLVVPDRLDSASAGLGAVNALRSGGLERVGSRVLPGADDSGIAVLEPALLVNVLVGLNTPLLLVGELQVLHGYLAELIGRQDGQDGLARLHLHASVPSAATLGNVALPEVTALLAGNCAPRATVGMAVTPVYRRHADADEAWSARLAREQEATRAS